MDSGKGTQQHELKNKVRYDEAVAGTDWTDGVATAGSP